MKSRAFLWCSAPVLALSAALTTERAFGDEPTPPPITVEEMSDGRVLVHYPPETPEAPPKPRIPKRRSLALEAFGVVNVVLGGSGLFAGFLTAVASGTIRSCGSPSLSADGTHDCWVTNDHVARNIGIGMMLGGGALIGAGVPMIVFGKQPARVSHAVPEVAIGAGSASFAWKF